MLHNSSRCEMKTNRTRIVNERVVLKNTGVCPKAGGGAHIVLNAANSEKRLPTVKNWLQRLPGIVQLCFGSYPAHFTKNCVTPPLRLGNAAAQPPSRARRCLCQRQLRRLTAAFSSVHYLIPCGFRGGGGASACFLFGIIMCVDYDKVNC